MFMFAMWISGVGFGLFMGGLFGYIEGHRRAKREYGGGC